MGKTAIEETRELMRELIGEAALSPTELFKRDWRIEKFMIDLFSHYDSSDPSKLPGFELEGSKTPWFPTKTQLDDFKNLLIAGGLKTFIDGVPYRLPNDERSISEKLRIFGSAFRQAFGRSLSSLKKDKYSFEDTTSSYEDFGVTTLLPSSVGIVDDGVTEYDRHSLANVARELERRSEPAYHNLSRILDAVLGSNSDSVEIRDVDPAFLSRHKRILTSHFAEVLVGFHVVAVTNGVVVFPRPGTPLFDLVHITTDEQGKRLEKRISVKQEASGAHISPISLAGWTPEKTGDDAADNIFKILTTTSSPQKRALEAYALLRPGNSAPPIVADRETVKALNGDSEVAKKVRELFAKAYNSSKITQYRVDLLGNALKFRVEIHQDSALTQADISFKTKASGGDAGFKSGGISVGIETQVPTSTNQTKSPSRRTKNKTVAFQEHNSLMRELFPLRRTVTTELVFSQGTLLNEGINAVDAIQYLLGAATEYGISVPTFGAGVPAGLAAETVIDGVFASEAVAEAVQTVSNVSKVAGEFSEILNTAMAAKDKIASADFAGFYEQVKQVIQRGLKALGEGAEKAVKESAKKFSGIVKKMIKKISDVIGKAIKFLIPEASIGTLVAESIEQIMESLTENAYSALTGALEKAGKYKEYFTDPNKLPSLLEEAIPKLNKFLADAAAAIEKESYVKAMLAGPAVGSALLIKKLGPKGLRATAAKLEEKGPALVDLAKKVMGVVIPATFSLLAVAQILLKGEYVGGVSDDSQEKAKKAVSEARSGVRETRLLMRELDLIRI